MNNSKLFDSKTDPIPDIRRDIEIIPVQDHGNSYLYFHDLLGYATSDFALNDQVTGILSLLDGRKSIRDLSPFLGNGIDEDQLLNYIRFLDENRLLHSPHFKDHAEQIEQKYEASDTHQSVTAESSYPSDPETLTRYLDDAFSEISESGITLQPKHIKALYAPHIDPRVGLHSYVKAFTPLRDLKPTRIVILATSHYSGLYPRVYRQMPFIITKKNFEFPFGNIPNDTESVERLLQSANNMGLTSKDRAHRIEHSIELHLLFLRYLWDHDFSIVPILVGGFDELYYLKDGQLGNQIRRFASLLKKQFGEDRETLFLISGDLAHFGKKFGDEVTARTLFDDVKEFDQRFLTHAQAGDGKRLLQLIKEKHDPYRICGFPPLYTFLQAMPNIKGQRLSYDLWDETERDSAVTFGSIAFWTQDKTS